MSSDILFTMNISKSDNITFRSDGNGEMQTSYDMRIDTFKLDIYNQLYQFLKSLIVAYDVLIEVQHNEDFMLNDEFQNIYTITIDDIHEDNIIDIQNEIYTALNIEVMGINKESTLNNTKISNFTFKHELI